MKKKNPSGFADEKKSFLLCFENLFMNGFKFSVSQKALKFSLWIELSISRLPHIRHEKLKGKRGHTTIKSILVSLTKFSDLITTY